MKQWGNKLIEKELKISKKQSKIERYDYLCSSFNAIDYCVNLEKYTNKLKNKLSKENTNLKQALIDTRGILNNHKDLGQAEELDYYAIRQNILQIIDEVLGGSDE